MADGGRCSGLTGRFYLTSSERKRWRRAWNIIERLRDRDESCLQVFVVAYVLAFGAVLV